MRKEARACHVFGEEQVRGGEVPHVEGCRRGGLGDGVASLRGGRNTGMGIRWWGMVMMLLTLNLR